MWDHEWIRHHIFNPDSRLQSSRSSRRERSDDQTRPSSSTRLQVRFPRPVGRVVPPPVAYSSSPMVASPTLSEDVLLHEDPAEMILLSEPSPPSLSTGHATTSSQPSVVVPGRVLLLHSRLWLVPARVLLLLDRPLVPARVLLLLDRPLVPARVLLPSRPSVPLEVLLHLCLVIHCLVVAVDIVEIVTTGLATMVQRRNPSLKWWLF